MRILIAEDEVATAKALKLLLEKAKYSVDIVHTGTDAWDYLRAGAYEVVVLDIMMPGMSGLEVLSLMRRNRMSTPVLLLTAKEEADGRTAVVFLNTSREQQMMLSLQKLTIAVSFASLLLVFGLVVLFSGRAIRPIANNIKQQKQFITDASHELKTPITSISTSVDVLEMEHGEDEWTENIRQQTARMSKLVSELVTLSKLDEEIPLPNKEQFSFSNAAWEIVEVYQPQAKAQGKNLTVEIEDNLDLIGEKAAVQQMLSVLLDNAIRYSDPNGEIRFRVFKKRSKVRIEVFNTCDLKETPDVNRLFDRFYRPDSSRSTEAGGNGVGLAIAKAVAETHGGSISASCQSGKSMTIKVVL